MRSLRPWKTTEVAVLRELYGTAGAAGVHERLPHRTLASIRAKAHSEGIKGIRCSTLGRRFARKYEPTEQMDMMIRDAYTAAQGKGHLAGLAARCGRPAWWVQRRATKLGVSRSNSTRADAWTLPERRILEQWREADTYTLARKLREAGFRRTPTAVEVFRKRHGLNREARLGEWSASDLAPLFGRDPKTIADWIDRRGLKAKRVSWGPNGKLIVRLADLKAWVKANQHLVDLRRVDQPWFWEVMFGVSMVDTVREAA